MRDYATPRPFVLATILLVGAMAGPVLVLLATLPPSAAVAAFALPAARSAVQTSLLASALATGIASLLGIPAGYWLARSRSRLRPAALAALALPLAFPPVASGILLLQVIGTREPLGAWLALHGVRLVDAFGGVTLAEFFVAGSFVALAATAAFASLDRLPEEAARTLGAGEWRIFTRIALPAALGNVAAGIAFAWLRALGEYGATSVVAYHPTALPVAVYIALAASGVRAALALCYGFVILAIVVLGLQWVLRRHVV
ncbi:MAG: molybdate ABC transporter permease subunit [Vulcanimicrobiaceae bacterium]